MAMLLVLVLVPDEPLGCLHTPTSPLLDVCSACHPCVTGDEIFPGLGKIGTHRRHDRIVMVRELSSIFYVDSGRPSIGKRRMSESTNADAFLTQHEAELKIIAKRLCRDRAEAADLVQDTFERALRTAGQQVVRNPRAWLVTIMHNLFIDRCRRKSREPSMVPVAEQAHATEPEPEPEWATISMSDLRTALSSLDDGFRRVYEMHSFEGASYDQIARALNIAKNTVGTRLMRARQKLRELLRAEHTADGVTSAKDYDRVV